MAEAGVLEARLTRKYMFSNEMHLFHSGLGRGFFLGATAPVAGDEAAPGAAWVDTGNALLKYNSGTKASPTWTSAVGAAATLDACFDAGKVINGAITEATAFRAGGATDYFAFWQEGANDIRIGTSSGADISIIPDGGTVAGWSGGYYFRCYDGAADDFTVGQYGAVVIAGNASTDVLTITTGDVQIDDGKLEIDTNEDDTTYIKRNQGTTTGPMIEFELTAAGDTETLLLLDHNCTGAGNALTIDSEATADIVVITGLSAAASLIKATAEAATGTVFEGIAAASSTVSALSVGHSGTGATGWLGAQNIGMVHIASDGTLAHVDASLLYIANSGVPQNDCRGSCLRIVDTGNAVAGTAGYAVYISASDATMEAIYVDQGKCLFDEQIQLGGGWATVTGAFVLSDSGAASMDLDGGAANDTFNIGATTDTDVIFHGTTAANDMMWDASENELYLLDGVNLKIGGTADRVTTESTNGIYIFNGTAPSGNLANGITLYAAAGELIVLDATDNASTLSPHTKVDGSPGGEFWTYHSKNHTSGKTVHIDVERMLRDLADKFDLSEYIHDIG